MNGWMMEWLWLQSGGAGGTAGSPPVHPAVANLLFLLALILIFYFLLIRPQIRRNKELRRFIESIQPGMRIVTRGGIHGEVVKVYSDGFLLRTAGKTEIKIDRSAVDLETTRLVFPEQFARKDKEKKEKGKAR